MAYLPIAEVHISGGLDNSSSSSHLSDPIGGSGSFFDICKTGTSCVDAADLGRLAALLGLESVGDFVQPDRGRGATGGRGEGAADPGLSVPGLDRLLSISSVCL